MNKIEEEIAAIEQEYDSIPCRVRELLDRIEAIKAQSIVGIHADHLRHLELTLLELRDFLNSQ